MSPDDGTEIFLRADREREQRRADRARERLRRERRRRSRRRRRLLEAALLLSALGLLTVAGAGVAAKVMLSDCSLNQVRAASLGQNSFLYAADGTLLGSIPSSINRTRLDLWRISPWLPRATVAIEDRRFYQHGGLDYRAIVRAAVANLRARRIVQGGSTITQELVRNLYLGNAKRSFGRKIEEACLANKLADRMTKRQILAAYLNVVFYGRGAYGAEAAAQTYFSRHAAELNLPQAALLAGLPQAPTVYDPTRRPAAARARRDDVLRAMRSTRAISQAQFDWAVATPLRLRPSRLYTNVRHSNYVGWAQQQLTSHYGRRVAAGGLHVQTLVRPSLQAAALGAIASHLHSRTGPSASLVSIDPWSGAVVAMVNYLPGGRELQFNLATQGHRQAGSAFKPFVLATALNQGISPFTRLSGPSSITISDQRCSTNGTPWEAHNYANESAGTMSLVEATVDSVNTIYAQLAVEVGPESVIPVAHRMGIRSPLQPVCSLPLGTQAVNPLEMTNAYATLARRGIRHRPQAFGLVRGPRGAVLHRLDTHGERAIPQTTADMVTQVLQQVVTRGTGTAAALGDRPVAGKTGTAEDYADAWFCGYVPQLATCVWVGYPARERPLENVEGLPVVFGGSIPAEIWHDYMTVALAHTPIVPFVDPASMAEADE